MAKTKPASDSLAWRPIDQAAKTGRFHCVRDTHGHQHSAIWQDGAWHYGSGQRLDRTITDYIATKEPNQ